MLVGRFAPSPTGRMHLGNAFAALLAWLSVRNAGGTMLLRLEDLDPDRSRQEYARQLQEDLRWLGLDWDAEMPPQSKRTPAYAAAFNRLAPHCYPCYCSRADLHAASAPHAVDGKLIYPGTCRGLNDTERAAKTRAPSWRLRVPDREISFTDGVFGTVSTNLARDCGDFILRRSDGVYAYQLAVVCDDAYGGVNQIVRGCDLLSSTPQQLYLMQLLDLTPPQYCHIPLLTDETGRRLSKRDRDLDLGALRSRFKPWQLIGALAFAAGIVEKNEPVSARELAQHFTWRTVRRCSAIPIRPYLPGVI